MISSAILIDMEYRIHGFRHGDYLAMNVAEYRPYWTEVKYALESVSDDDLIAHFKENGEGSKKSISATINELLKQRFTSMGWNAESQIFSEHEYSENGSIFRLDFAKGIMSIEVAFNHGNDAPWNLLKPTLASELNHVEKAIQTEIGIIITATEEMKVAGGFDTAVGSYEKYIRFLRPMGMLLTAPLVIIGLEAPETFHIEHHLDGRRKLGYIVRNSRV